MSNLSLGASAYVPSWMKKDAAPAKPTPAPSAAATTAVPAPTGAPRFPPATAPMGGSRMTVTRTTTNATSAMPATPGSYYAPPPPAPAGMASAYTGVGSVTRPLGSGSRTSSTNLQPLPSPSMLPNGGSPSLRKHLPTRLSPAVAPMAANHHMNPNAAEFVPGRASGGGAAGLDILPTSTADLEAAKEVPTPSRQPLRSPAWQPSYKRQSNANSPAMAPLRLGGKSEQEIAAIGMRSVLKADAPVYNPSESASRRTLNRLVLAKPSPLVLAQDPSKSGMDMMLDDLWCLFYMPANFGESIKEETYNPTLVFRIESIPTFWKVVNNVPTPTAMQLSTLYLFKDGIDPKWEDPANRNGGIVKVKVGTDQVDEAWELLLCKTIGDSWTPSVRSTINGVALKVRDRGYLLEVWVTKQTPELMRDLAELWREALGAAFAAGYYSHEAMQTKAAAAAAAAAEKQKKQHAQRKRW